MSESINLIMEEASQALVRMDYLQCESLCLQALAMARQQQQDWPYYARILMPLQEARRQRRMIASEGVVRLGTDSLQEDPVQWLDRIDQGCLVVTRPHDAQVARHLQNVARDQRMFIEILYADNHPTQAKWTLRSFDGRPVSCEVDAPDKAWRDRWLDASENSESKNEPAHVGAKQVKITQRPADWFLDACEALGDAALATVTAPPGDPQRVAALESCLQAVTSHEILHQRLSDAAKALAVQQHA